MNPVITDSISMAQSCREVESYILKSSLSVEKCTELMLMCHQTLQSLLQNATCGINSTDVGSFIPSENEIEGYCHTLLSKAQAPRPVVNTKIAKQVKSKRVPTSTEKWFASTILQTYTLSFLWAGYHVFRRLIPPMNPGFDFINGNR